MSFFTDLHAAVDRVALGVGADTPVDELPAAVNRLSSEQLELLIRDVGSATQCLDRLRAAAAGVAEARSTREAGHGGMAQKRGHRSAVSLIQDLTGVTKIEATKQVRLGEALLAASLLGATSPDAEPGGSVNDAAPNEPAAPKKRPWHAVLSDAFLAGSLTGDEKNAILRGLGEPPAHDDDEMVVVHDAWATAAEQLIAEAAERTVEELLAAARSVRDLLDPKGCGRRFDERLTKRTFRVWRDADGGRHARIDFDDDGGAFTQAIIDAALRPRRGGPRFVDADEATRAAQLEQDPRTNDQLTYDLMMDVIRAGALADADQVFGTRQAGLRLVVTADSAAAERAGAPAVAILEDDGAALPAWLAAQHACSTGTTTCTFDGLGNPLDVGREQRLFTPKQRIALANRDGGCRWRGCDRPASYCESHHIDPYAQGGRTDIDRGILLCRWHHMELHHGGWSITRLGKDEFVLHPPPGRGEPMVLATRLVRRYAFGDLAPPPRRFRPAA